MHQSVSGPGPFIGKVPSGQASQASGTRGSDPRGFVWRPQEWCGLRTMDCQVTSSFAQILALLSVTLGKLLHSLCFRHFICKMGIV